MNLAQEFTAKRLVDHALHVLWAACILVPTLMIGGAVGGMLSGLVFALPRELWDQRPQPFSWRGYNWMNTVTDCATCAIGGLLAALFF